mgnify:CR=1 FL=1
MRRLCACVLLVFLLLICLTDRVCMIGSSIIGFDDSEYGWSGVSEGGCLFVSVVVDLFILGL